MYESSPSDIVNKKELKDFTPHTYGSVESQIRVEYEKYVNYATITVDKLDSYTPMMVQVT